MCITVDGHRYDDIDEARAEAPIVYGLDARLAEEHFAAAFAARQSYASGDEWRAAIEGDFTLPANRRVGVLTQLHHYSVAGLTSAWDGASGSYVLTRTDGTALPKRVRLAYQWADDLGYAALSAQQETLAELVLTVRVPTRYWPLTANPRNQHASRVITPALLQVATLANELLTAGGVVLPAAPAVLGQNPAVVLAPNVADRARVARLTGATESRRTAEQEQAVAVAQTNEAAAAAAASVVDRETALLTPVLAELNLGATRGAQLGQALACLRTLCGEVGADAARTEYALGLFLRPLQAAAVVTAFTAHSDRVEAAGDQALARFEEVTVFSEDVVAHLLFGQPRTNALFVAQGIAGGHVEADLRTFLTIYPEYDVVVDTESETHTAYLQFKWIPDPAMAAANREDTRPSGDGGLTHHDGWREAAYPKTVTTSARDLLWDGERSFRAWFGVPANSGQITALVVGTSHVARFASVGAPGMSFDAYVERVAAGRVRLKTLFPVLG